MNKSISFLLLPVVILLGCLNGGFAQTLQASQNFESVSTSGIPYTGTAVITSYTADQNSNPRPRNGVVSNGYNSGTLAWNLINGGNGTATQSLTFKNINFQAGSINNYIQFRLASLANVPNQGADLADNITVELSADYGANFYTALTVTGQNRRINDPTSGAGETVWTYAASQTATGSFNGLAPSLTVNTTFTPTSNGDLGSAGYGTVRINLTNVGQVVVRITLTNTDNNEIWAVDDFGVYSTLPVTLPVTLTQFSAARQAQRVAVSWATAAEIQNAYFEVQRSTDGIHFDALGRVAGNGTTSTGASYSFLDQQPLDALGYYRLKQVDVDGTSTFSSVIVVAGRKFSASFHPNPSTQYISLPVSSGLVQYRVYSSTGKTVATGEAQGGATVDLQRVPTGIYFLELITGSQRNAQRFVRQ